MTVRRAYVSAVLLLIGMTLLLQHYSRAEELPGRKRFPEFPLRLAGQGSEGVWQGREIGLEPDVLSVLRVDDYMLRAYVPMDRTQSPVWLYVGYYASQRTGVTYHSPLNCLPGSGWSVLTRDEMTVNLGRPADALRVNRVVIQKGLDKQLVLYWYQDRGRRITSEYWAKAYLIWDAMTRNRTDGALVRLSIPMTSPGGPELSRDEAATVGERFLRRVGPLLSEYLPV